MLTSLRIRNLALIDALELRLGEGLTVLTGETGAGKSIIVEAFSLVLGDRAAAEVVRQGLEEAEVEALFDDVAPPVQAALDEMGIGDPERTLVVRRVVSRSGKGRVYLNGRMATLADLRRVIGPLVDISSQHAHTSLLKVAEHRAVLDRFGELRDPLAAYEAAYAAWREAEDAHTSLQAAERSRAEREDYLRFQVAELDAAAPSVGEDEELGAERELLKNATGLREAAARTERLLHGDREAVTDRLADVERALRSMASADPTLGALADRVESTRIELKDVAGEARSYLSRISADPRRLEEIEERLQTLKRLMRKHGSDLAAVIAKHRALKAELDQLASLEERLGALKKAAAASHALARTSATALTAARREVATRAQTLVERQLGDLGMPGARFEVAVTASDELGPHGGDRVELLLSTNVGEAPLPLARIASGGELSRIMLALKHVLATADTVDCYVFDEVDTGVSGGIAERIGVKLRETASQRQVLCITHLPQVACQADHHLRVFKRVEDGRTVTDVAVLDAPERREELARLLGGVEVTEEARVLAGEMLRKSRQSSVLSHQFGHRPGPETEN